ncbi:MAG: response regulator [Aliidongia sp.]
MVQALRVLVVEDNERDEAMLLRELKRGYEIDHIRVETAAAMADALRNRRWDLIVSDYSLPQFSAHGALEVLAESGIDLPFIIVSGTIGEEAAVEAMRAGAHDFMPKGKFTRLLPAIARELREAAIRAEHRAIEQRLRQAQKMEAMGQLTGGVAHDFNNLLGVIVGNIDLLADAVRHDPAQIELVDAALASALRGAELTKRLLAFSRQQPLSTRAMDLNEKLPDMIAVLHRTLGEAIRIVPQLGTDLWPVRTDASQLEDALLNLAINARDAMPNGGTLTIATANTRLDERQAALQTEVMPGDYVTLSVTDTGIGMPPEIIERAIEPFFTTKEPGKGTGLGLSMIYGFAKQSGGHLSIYSEVGVGTTIRLYLPREHPGPAAATPQPAAPGEVPKGGETVLVVDDNFELRRVAVRQLTSLGYRVREASDGPSALALLEEGAQFDLLFTDIGLPAGMNGFELAERMQQLLPGLKVLYTTGYGSHGRRNGIQDTDPVLVLQKPYRNRDLAERLRTVFDK